MKNGIGPQNLGASGMNPKSTPCGHSVVSPVNKLEDLSGDGKVTQKDVLIGRGVIDADGDKSSLNSGTPLYFQDDISKIQEAASTLEAHNIGGGGGEVQGAAAAAQESAAAQMGQNRKRGGFLGRLARLKRARIGGAINMFGAPR